MRKSLLGVATAVAVALAGGGALIPYGQPASPSGPGPRGATASSAPGWRHGPGMWRGRRAMMHPCWERMRPFAVFFHPEDRRPSADAVQKIAEAFLLWNGNHTLEVIDVAPTSDKQVSFADAAPDNTIIARFEMDTKISRLIRTG